MTANRNQVELRDLDPGGRLPPGLRAQRVPQQILGEGEYIIFDAVQMTEDMTVVVFAASGMHQRIGVVLESGAVKQVNSNGRLVAASPSIGEFTLVASTLQHWWKGLTGPASEAASDVRDHLIRIAPASFREDSYWTTMLDDVEIGDYDG